MYDQTKQCCWCGFPCYLGACEEHHLYRRSTHPNLKRDKQNIITLCSARGDMKKSCHARATDSIEFERRLQKAFYVRKIEKD